MILSEKTRRNRRKPYPLVPHCAPQIPYGLTQTRMPGLRGESLATNRLTHGTTKFLQTSTGSSNEDQCFCLDEIWVTQSHSPSKKMAIF